MKGESMKSLSSKTLKQLSIFFAAILLIGFAFTWWFMTKGTEIPFSALEKIIHSKQNEALTLKEMVDGTIILTTEEEKYITQFRPHSLVIEELVQKYNIHYEYSPGTRSGGLIFIGIIILILLLAFIIYKKQAGGLGKVKHKTAQPLPLPSISFQNIGGLSKELIDDIEQTLAIMKNREQAKQLGIDAPKGILLYGPPGTGKTLLAQAIANEMGAHFFSASGSAFTELFVGVGAARIRNLFENARKHAPSVIFIDEVDALAGKRKEYGGEEGEKTLTELLVQLDGGHDNEGILFLAATNRKDMLDDAFLRPGRIDYSFYVPLPDKKGRREIIDIHRKGKNLAKDVLENLDSLAETTSGFSGAEIKALFDMANRKVIREQRSVIEWEDIHYALDRTILGSTSRVLQDAAMKKRIAIHEAGHALVQAITRPHTIRKATIIPRGQALGYVASIPKEINLATPSELMDQLSIILAGGVAERLFLGEHSLGVSGDVEQAKTIIKEMVDVGLLEDGFTLTFQKQSKEEKMNELFQTALNKTEKILKYYSLIHEDLVEALLTKETLDGEEIQKIVDSRIVLVPFS